MMPWLLVSAIVTATATGDVLQSWEMKRHGEATIADTAGRVFRRPLLIASIGCMAVSFFAFLMLLRVADLSFAVPATAASFVVETLAARLLLREKVDARRWAGALLVACGVALLAL